MIVRLSAAATAVIAALAVNTVLCTGSVQAQGRPEVFDPNQSLTLDLEMLATAGNIIHKDLTFQLTMQDKALDVYAGRDSLAGHRQAGEKKVAVTKQAEVKKIL